MILSSSQRFVIDSENIDFIEDNMKKLSPLCIIRNKLMTRTIFDVTGRETMWLRIRTGDVDCARNPITSASLLEKTPNEQMSCSAKKSITLQLTDYYNDVAFFKNMGMRVVSEQETRRTKYVCHLDGIKYTICLDIWPKLENYIFVSITPATNADREDLDAFVNELKVSEYSVEDFPIDVDEAYFRITGKIARDYEYLRFE